MATYGTELGTRRYADQKHFINRKVGTTDVSNQYLLTDMTFTEVLAVKYDGSAMTLTTDYTVQTPNKVTFVNAITAGKSVEIEIYTDKLSSADVTFYLAAANTKIKSRMAGAGYDVTTVDEEILHDLANMCAASKILMTYTDQQKLMKAKMLKDDCEAILKGIIKGEYSIVDETTGEVTEGTGRTYYTVGQGNSPYYEYNTTDGDYDRRITDDTNPENW